MKKTANINPDVSDDSSKQRHNVGDDDIPVFTDLLAGAKTSDAAPNQKPKQTCHASNSVTVIDRGNAVLYQPGLKTFLPIGDKIVCCRSSDQGYVLSMFHQTALKSDLDTLTYEALPRFTMSVEVATPAVSLNSTIQSCNWSYYIPQLLFVQPGSSTSHLVPCATVKRRLFNILFNGDASLVDSPVVIFGAQDGQIFFWPLNNFALTSKSTEVAKTSQRFTPQLLYHLEQGVSAIYSTNLVFQGALNDQGDSSKTSERAGSDKLQREEGSSDSNAIIFVGKRDKIVIVCEEKSISGKGRISPVKFSEHTIIGPVICSCLNNIGDTLIHSTEKEIFITKFCISSDNTAKATAVLSSLTPSILTTSSIQIPNVRTVCCVFKKSKADGGKRLEKVYSLTLNGKLLMFLMPESQDGCSLTNISPQAAGEKVKAYLSEIEAQSAELARVNSTIESEDKILKELNKAIHIGCQLSQDTQVSNARRTDLGNVSVPIACTFTASFSSHDSNGIRSVSVHCKIVNQGNLPLSSCWSLMVQIQGKDPWLHHTTHESCIPGQSVPLKSLNPGSFLELDIPLSKSLCSSFHIVAEAHLFCDLKQLLADLSDDSATLNSVEDVVFPIRRQVMDVLHFVRPNPIGSRLSVPNVMPDSKEELKQTLDRLNVENQRHCIHVHDLSRDGEITNTEEISHGNFVYSATFQISQDAVDFMKRITIQREVVPESTQITTNQTTVLRFIFEDSSLSEQQINTGYSCIDVLSVNGSRVTVQVKPLSGGISSADNPPLELAIHCSSVHLLCRMHEAVLTRLKVS